LKVFEALILNIHKDNLETDELQFGFKQGIGCMDVIFFVKTVVDYFIVRGSAVYAATLDLKEALDSVDHHELYKTLLVVSISYPIVNIICCWYGKLFVAVHRNSHISR
jgi:Reverse transcriptase (RNA-dependent DNA polymerase)